MYSQFCILFTRLLIGVRRLTVNLQHLDLIDLLSERHLLLRDLLEKQWNDISDIKLSNSEWFILARIYQEEQTTISYITKHVDISRQAVHKSVQRLREKELVIVRKHENNKKERLIELTKFGTDCYEKNEELKTELESRITNQLGAEEVNRLKGILKSNWGV